MRVNEMSQRALILLAAFFMTMFLPACIMTKADGEKLKQELLTTNAQLESLEKDYSQKSGKLDELVVQLQSELEQLKKHSQATTASDHVELDRIRRDILMLTGMIENQGYEVQQSSLKLQEKIDELTQRVLVIEAKLNITPPGEKQKAAAANNAGGNSSAAIAASSEPAADDPKELYRQARKLISDGNTVDGRRLFVTFIQKFPNHRLTDDAQYWIGESYLNEKNFHQAVMEFQKVVDKYKKTGDMIAPALAKLGDSFRMLGMNEDARLFYQEVIAQYPKSDSAERARAALKKMK